jgi:hypothetical protein
MEALARRWKIAPGATSARRSRPLDGSADDA